MLYLVSSCCLNKAFFLKLCNHINNVLLFFKDKLHVQAAIEFTKKGYHMLLEKPMATSLEDCRQITMACRAETNQINAVCHVLRYYSPCNLFDFHLKNNLYTIDSFYIFYFNFNLGIKLKQLIDSGLIGSVVHIGKCTLHKFNNDLSCLKKTTY